MKNQILIVDDGEALVNTLYNLLTNLSDEQYDVEVATSGTSALNLLHHKSFDLVVSDYELPDISGLEILSEACSINEQTQTILMTASKSPYIKEQARDLIKGFLAKPFTASAFLEAIQTTLVEQVSEEPLMGQTKKQAVSNGTACQNFEEDLPFKRILDAIQDGVAYAINGQVKYVNSALLQLTGYSSADIMAQSQNDISHQGGSQGIDLMSIIGNPPCSHQWQGEVTLHCKDGSKFDASITKTPIKVGKDTGSLTIIKDLSEEKDQQAIRDRFIANASHEIRTPVSNLNMRLYLLKKQPERLNEHIDVMSEEVERLQNLVKDLLDLSRSERDVMTLNCADIVLQDILNAITTRQQIQANQKNIRLSQDTPLTPVKAHLDVQRITQVMVNLITNAINYTPEGGQVTLRLTSSEEQIVIQVEDNGQGIPPEFHDYIFEPFSRIRAQDEIVQGTGLGLTIAKEIVVKHGGDITVLSEIGKGSVFSVLLPPTPRIV